MERKPSDPDLQTLEAKFDAFVERFEERDRRLFGNGQPGILDKHTDKLAEHDRKFSFQQGALWALGGLLTMLESAHILLVIFKH